jgi:hypothetical protein
MTSLSLKVGGVHLDRVLAAEYLQSVCLLCVCAEHTNLCRRATGPDTDQMVALSGPGLFL